MTRIGKWSVGWPKKPRAHLKNTSSALGRRFPSETASHLLTIAVLSLVGLRPFLAGTCRSGPKNYF